MRKTLAFLAFFSSGFLLALVFSPVFAQVKVSSGDSYGALKFATTTFEAYDTYTKVVSDANNTKQITDRLDIVIQLLGKISQK